MSAEPDTGTFDAITALPPDEEMTLLLRLRSDEPLSLEGRSRIYLNMGCQNMATHRVSTTFASILACSMCLRFAIDKMSMDVMGETSEMVGVIPMTRLSVNKEENPICEVRL